MKRSIVSLCLFVLLSLPFLGASTLPRLAELQKFREKKVNEINIKYDEILDKTQVKLTKASRFLDANSITEVKKQLKEGEIKSSDKLASEIKLVLRKREEDLTRVDSIYLRQLRKFKASFAKKGELDAVNQIDDLLAEVEKKSPNSEFASIIAETSSKFKLKKLRPGQDRLIRYDTQFSKVSKELNGFMYTQMQRGDHVVWEVTAETSGDIIVITHKWREPKHPVAPKKKLNGAIASKKWFENFNVYRFSLLKGKTYTFESAECMLIAPNISHSKKK